MTVKAGPLAAAAVAAGALLGAAGGARAHPEFSALGTNRYVTAAVIDGRVDVTDALLEGLLTGGDDRRRMDADGDGAVSAAELEAVRARLRAEGPAISVFVDDRALGASLDVSVELGDEPRADDAPLVVERRQSFASALGPGLHQLRLVVTREPPRLLDTELAVALTPGLVLRGGPDHVPFRGPRASTFETRAATFALDVPAPPGRSRAPIALAALGVVAGALALASVRWWRRARRSS